MGLGCLNGPQSKPSLRVVKVSRARPNHKWVWPALLNLCMLLGRVVWIDAWELNSSSKKRLKGKAIFLMDLQRGQPQLHGPCHHVSSCDSFVGLVWFGLVWFGLVWIVCLFVCLFVCLSFVCRLRMYVFVCLLVCSCFFGLCFSETEQVEVRSSSPSLGASARAPLPQRWVHREDTKALTGFEGAFRRVLRTCGGGPMFGPEHPPSNLLYDIVIIVRKGTTPLKTKRKLAGCPVPLWDSFDAGPFGPVS